jgi:hypothetical protein
MLFGLMALCAPLTLFGLSLADWLTRPGAPFS